MSLMLSLPFLRKIAAEREKELVICQSLAEAIYQRHSLQLMGCHPSMHVRAWDPEQETEVIVLMYSLPPAVVAEAG